MLGSASVEGRGELRVAKTRALSLIVLLAAAFQAGAGAARADSNLIVGVTEDNLMYSPAETIAIANDLGVKAFRLSLLWEPGRAQLDPATRSRLDNAVAAASGTRIVVAVYSGSGNAPLSPAARDEYCTYVRSVLEHYPQINDVVVWNEPNLTYFWRPQYNRDGTSAAPGAYQELLAQCWDVLHAYRPNVNVIGPVVSYRGHDNPNGVSDNSHSPLRFIRELGDAYRASGRARPILDTFGHHPHPWSADERPWRRHDSSVYVSLGDWGKLMNGLAEAFEGTAQPLPGQGPSIWWLEVGYQTLIDADKRHLYDGRVENWRGPVPDFVGGEPDHPQPSADSPAPDQATQLIDSVRLSYCQPYVEAYFNFLLRDESSLTRWQSGVLWVDGSPKGSYAGFKGAITEVNQQQVDCSRMKGGGPFIAQTGAGPRTKPAAGVSRVAGGGFWDELGPKAPLPRPSRPGARSVPSGFFAQATPSTLEYNGTRRGAFGFVTLRSRLSAEGRPVAGKGISIIAGGRRYAATTNANGVATVSAGLPVPLGKWNIRASFPGDPAVRPAVSEAIVRVVNTRARVTSTRDLVASRRSTGSFRVSYDGRSVKGRVRVQAPGLKLRAGRVTALGVNKRGNAAWFAGFSRSGTRFLAYAEDNSRRGRRDRFRLWIGDSARVAPGKLRSGNVKITTRRPSENDQGRSGEGRNRTGDTTVFSRVLYRLSYLAARAGLSVARPQTKKNVRAGATAPRTFFGSGA
jgi:hypothetical protein